SHHPDHIGLRPNELDVAGFANLGKVWRLRQEAVTGMNSINVKDLRRANDCGNIQVTLRGRSWSNTSGLIGKTHVQGISIHVAMHSDCLDTHFLTRPDNATGNFAAVGYQYLFELASVERHEQIIWPKKLTSSIRRYNRVGPWTFDSEPLPFDSKERLPIFNRLAVLNIDLDDFALGLCLDLIHKFHCLDDADDGFRFDLATNFYKRLGSGRRG